MTTAPNPTSDLADVDILWKTADALRAQVDAAQFKHVVLGLLFLKYISDAFESRRDELRQELLKDGITGCNAEPLLESRDEYLAERVFWVPPESRWPNLENQATRVAAASPPKFALADSLRYKIIQITRRLSGKCDLSRCDARACEIRLS